MAPSAHGVGSKQWHDCNVGVMSGNSSPSNLSKPVQAVHLSEPPLQATSPSCPPSNLCKFSTKQPLQVVHQATSANWDRQGQPQDRQGQPQTQLGPPRAAPDRQGQPLDRQGQPETFLGPPRAAPGPPRAAPDIILVRTSPAGAARLPGLRPPGWPKPLPLGRGFRGLGPPRPAKYKQQLSLGGSWD